MNVLVTAKLHPASNARLIMADEVVGVAEASPKGFSNLSPATSTKTSTWSTGVKNLGSWGSGGMNSPCNDWEEGGREGKEEREESIRIKLIQIRKLLQVFQITQNR